MKPSEYPSTAPDWEARQLNDFHISPNRRARDTDYPINDTNLPIEVANFNGIDGGTVLYAGHFPRFHPSDFRVGPGPLHPAVHPGRPERRGCAGHQPFDPVQDSRITHHGTRRSPIMRTRHFAAGRR